ncbi:MAG: protein-L-isoaspartate(D-aspartate) O-methyltransferase [Nitrospirae bacterium]|nr:protein-L-isoaspartate(D-aspartate) O-methyltransferase [Nitrospirota bacterium]
MKRVGREAREGRRTEAVAPEVAADESEFATARERMVSVQIEARGVKDPAVLKAMRAVRRHLFVPAAELAEAYEDRPLPIGDGQTISQPYIVALMTELLQAKPGGRVLEVGTGSGYQAAVLAEMGLEVYSIEIIPELAEAAMDRLQRLGYLAPTEGESGGRNAPGKVRVRIGDGYNGWPDVAPFEGILVTAAAEDIPPALVEQLKPTGRLVIPMGSGAGEQDLVLVTRDEKGRIRTRTIVPVRFVPLVHAP